MLLLGHLTSLDRIRQRTDLRFPIVRGTIMGVSIIRILVF